MNTSPLVRTVRPSRASSTRDLPALETALAGLALDEHTPIALDIAATATSRQFVLRAEHPAALSHLASQIQGRYPQAVIEEAPADPLQCLPGEACSMLELRPGAAVSLPLRSWKARELITEGTDPLLGILAAFGTLPAGTRAVAHLALVPATPTWSAAYRQDAVPHPFPGERTRTSGGPPEKSLKDVLLLFPVVLVLLLCYTFHRVLPAWLWQALVDLLRGESPHLTTAETLSLVVSGGAALLLCLGGSFLVTVLMSRLGTPRVTDPRLVAEKTARPAYRVRLRLVVFAPDVPPVAMRVAMQHLWRQLPIWFARRMHPADLPRLWGRLRASWQGALLCRQMRHRHAQERLALARVIAAAYRQYHLAAGGYFLPHVLSRRQVRRLLAPGARHWFRRMGWATDVRSSTHYLSVADLATLWHLPQASDLPDLVYVDHAAMRTRLAPAILAQGQGYPLGTSTHAGQTLPVFLPFACLLRNTLAAASTGKGKSNLLYHLVRAFALGRQGKRSDVPDGTLVVDIHGDLVRLLAGSLPPALADDIVLINLADRAFPIAFNPLDMSGGTDRDKLIDNLIQVIESLWPTSYGPRTESFLEYCCKTLAEANASMLAADPVTGADQQYTLLDVMPLLRRPSFRQRVLEQVTDPFLLAWWQQYYELLDPRQQADFTSSLVTKLAKFASSQRIRRIIGQPRSTINLRELISQNKIILFDCASGEIGADMAALFGSVFVGFFQTALAEQARLRPAERHRFLVVIDEFQALSGINYQAMLAELRKYGGSFVLATQSMAYLDRLERTLRATVLANMEHLFAFAMADEDARLLRLPDVEPEDLAHLPDYTCYARLALDGQRLPVFSLRLDGPEPADTLLEQRLVDQGRARYGRPAGESDQLLQACLARQEGTASTGSGSHLAGVATLAEAIARSNRKRRRGSGGTKLREQDSASGPGRPADTPPHVMYDDLDEDLPLP
jgi:hypothetical protein